MRQIQEFGKDGQKSHCKSTNLMMDRKSQGMGRANQTAKRLKILHFHTKTDKLHEWSSDRRTETEQETYSAGLKYRKAPSQNGGFFRANLLRPPTLGPPEASCRDAHICGFQDTVEI